MSWISMTDGRKIFTVSELNKEIRIILEDSFPDVWLEGEISNFKAYPSGHLYFSLKDAESMLSAVMFQGSARYLKFRLEDGLKVVVRCKVSAYAKRGNYQVLVSSVEPAGRGALQLAFEQLKAKLEKEGLFSAERKRKIPLLPRRIGIVTSPTGAAIRDILTVINRRFANVEIILYPAHVQGDEAKTEIAQGIEYLNAHYPELDVLLVGRGGGSYEDLWAFNEEIVARAIAASRIPLISCVGHEIDYTIADFVADLRAPTPSAAAELVVRDKQELFSSLRSLLIRLDNRMRAILDTLDDRVSHLAGSRAMTDPASLFEERLRDIDDIFSRLSDSQKRRVKDGQARVAHGAGQLRLLSPFRLLAMYGQKLRHLASSRVLAHPEERLEPYQARIDDNFRRLKESAYADGDRRGHRLALAAGKLDLLSPLGILSRGYAICSRSSDNAIVRDALKDIREGDPVSVKVHKGSFTARVFEIQQGDPE